MSSTQIGEQGTGRVLVKWTLPPPCFDPLSGAPCLIFVGFTPHMSVCPRPLGLAESGLSTPAQWGSPHWGLSVHSLEGTWPYKGKDYGPGLGLGEKGKAPSGQHVQDPSRVTDFSCYNLPLGFAPVIPEYFLLCLTEDLL